MTTVNNIADILRIIREQPEWGEALRAALLSKEVLELPHTLAEFAQATDQRFARLEGDVAGLKEGQARLEAGQARLEGAVGNLQGNAYEQRVANNIASIVRQHLGIRRVRVLKGFKVSDEMAFHHLMDEAEDHDVISERERFEAGNTDIVLRGYSQQATTYLALEVSLTAGESDINRAADRAHILSRATGEATIPAVISAHLDESRRQLVASRNVALITVAE